MPHSGPPRQWYEDRPQHSIPVRRSGPPARRTRRRQRQRQRRRLWRRLTAHKSAQALLLALTLFLGWAGWSAGLTLIAPGNTGNAARLLLLMMKPC